MSEALIQVRGIRKTYRMGPETIQVIDGLDLDLYRGEIVAVVGASGIGKTTLLNVLGLLDTPDSGSVRGGEVELFDNPAELRAEWRNRLFGFVFQFYHLIPELTALENVMVPAMMYRSKRNGTTKAEIRERAREILGGLGLSERLRHRPKELSGGERQRVAIARALINEPEVLLCDEPTGNLDAKTSREVQQVLWDLNERTGQTILIVTHEAEIAQKAHRVLRMEDGKLVEEGANGDRSRAGDGGARVGHRVVSRMPLTQLFFSLEGRIGRSAYVVGLLTLAALAFGVGWLLSHFLEGHDFYPLYQVLCSLIFVWPNLALHVKRCHDIGRSGWFVAVTLIPVVGVFWFFALTLFKRGYRGVNRYGPDPRRAVYGTRPFDAP